MIGHRAHPSLRSSLKGWVVGCALLALSPWASAVHFDVEIRTDRGPVAGSRLLTTFYGDEGLDGILPIDGQTGYQIFPGYFGDLEGGPYLTDDPGFQAFNGTLSRGDEVHFRALGTLAWWNPSTGRWGPAPAGVSVALYGGIPNEVIVGYTDNPAAWQDQYAFYEAGTRFTAQGIEGPLTALIDDARSNGAFHAHLDWRIQSTQGSIPVGAYMVTIELWSPTLVNGQPKYLPARPVHVVFERGITEAQMRQAIQARVSPPVAPPSGGSSAQPPRAPWASPIKAPWALVP